MSELFLSFEKDFCDYMNLIKSELQSQFQSQETNGSIMSKIEKDIIEAEKCLRQMEIETSMMPANSRQSLQQEIRKFRNDLEIAKRQIRQEQALISDQKSKEMLMGTSLNKKNNNEQKERLLGANSLFIQQEGLIFEAKKYALEAENSSIEALSELKNQRETIQRSIQRNREVNENLTKGNRLISLMQSRAIQNKLIVYGIMILLSACLMFLVYMKAS
ncbi:VTI1_2 [Blepharisma stoltei]|uniref:Vesicle transport v-SNARE N-terminal domain-containing protein n=1 Tax=Blepharisma stoltei TaxID=1481888 RepID=A0AAU9J1C6_9CILI|nr:unnamed protein product [Blepharisma stoltei]